MRTGCGGDGEPLPSALSILPERATLDSQTSQGESKGLKVDLLVLFFPSITLGHRQTGFHGRSPELGVCADSSGPAHMCFYSLFSFSLHACVCMCAETHVEVR